MFRLIANYELIFGEKSEEWSSPAERGDHPEVDTSEFLDFDSIRQYMSLLGTLQCSISLCRFDIATAVMNLGRFRVAARVGHMDRMKRVRGYPRMYSVMLQFLSVLGFQTTMLVSRSRNMTECTLCLGRHPKSCQTAY
jgi:hypothetical protein